MERPGDRVVLGACTAVLETGCRLWSRPGAACGLSGDLLGAAVRVLRRARGPAWPCWTLRGRKN
eukprot:7390546-Pyramimonas_sp.AAC.1